ncbi:hypothetical protein [Deinococcus aquatilis]|uniref:hypothetical protein n=1 Tax=Deinococcus aquatilis TaxID=519440 RepID=UPI0012F9A322|nr:hypothetical protein [Deinococcus aquatilis]
MGFVRYQRDLPAMNYHFGKLGAAGWKALVEPDDTPADPYQERARNIWFAGYDLPELKARKVSKGVRRDFKRALKKKRVPNWVLNLISADEFKQLGGDEK